MFLVRAAFWFSIVVMLIPANPRTATPAPREAVVEALVAAQAVIADLSSFCDHSPDICETGSAAFQVFAEKAQDGARLLFRYLDESIVGGSAKDEEGTPAGGDTMPDWLGSADGGTA
jgi:hypothetical protein